MCIFKEEAMTLCQKFQQYELDSENKYVPSIDKTKLVVHKVIDEIEKQSSIWGKDSVVLYWNKVKIELNKL